MRTSDLQKVCQWAKSNHSPSDVYNAACRMLDEHALEPTPADDTTEVLRGKLERAELASEVVLAPDGNVSVVSHSNRMAADRALTVVSPEVERLRAELAEVKAHARHLDEARRLDVKWRQAAEAERDALKAAIERAKAEHTDDDTGACETCSNEDPTGLHDFRMPLPCPTLVALNATETPKNGAESQGGPQ